MKTQTQPAAATERPWTIEILSDMDVYIQAHNGSTDIARVFIPYDTGTDKANGQLIVKAVNEYEAHEAVAMAAKLVLAEICAQGNTDAKIGCIAEHKLTHALAALAAVQGGEPQPKTI